MSHHVAVDAAAALGWVGVVLPAVAVFGCRLQPVVGLDVDVHRSRESTGDGPQLDSDTLTVWEWPESNAPAPAVRLEGALFSAHNSFRRALGDARRWRSFGPSAVFAPGPMVADQVCRWDCALHGIGLVPDKRAAAASGHVVRAEQGRQAPARRRTADRWIEESLYAHALDTGAFLPA